MAGERVEFDYESIEIACVLQYKLLGDIIVIIVAILCLLINTIVVSS